LELDEKRKHQLLKIDEQIDSKLKLLTEDCERNILSIETEHINNREVVLTKTKKEMEEVNEK